MKENKTSGVSVSIGFPGLLGLVFIVLKLCKVIDWSWLWVLSPFWISFVIAMILSIVLGIISDRINRGW